MVITAGLMERSSPHSFSFGVCKLTMMMECGFMISHSQGIAFRGAVQECETKHARRVTLTDGCCLAALFKKPHAGSFRMTRTHRVAEPPLSSGERIMKV